MLIKEAEWIGESLPLLDLKQGSVFLNFGAQTKEYNQENNHILRYLINPIKSKHTIKNLDLQKGEGIDFSGDILDDIFFNELKKNKFHCILLCNVLEHVHDINKITQRLSDLMESGTYLIFSGPYKYPVHYDPIDNGFRPTVKEVEKLFPDLINVKSQIVIDHTYSFYLFSSFKKFAVTFLRILSPFYKFSKWKNVVLPKLRYLNKNFEATCIVFKKP